MSSKISWHALPSAKSLTEAGERSFDELVSLGLLPASYSGRAKDRFLALALLNSLQHASFDELVSRNKDVAVGSMDRDLAGAGFPMYALNREDAYHYWGYLDLFPDVLPKQWTRFLNYFCYLASLYEGEEFTYAIDLLHSIVPFQLKEMQYNYEELEFPEESQIRNFFALGKVIHMEGVVMSTSTLWLASRHWDSEMVIKLLEEKLPIMKAFQFYHMGFTTIEEMKEYDSVIPDEWLQRILGDGDDSDVFDYAL